MRNTSLFSRRFQELETESARVASTKRIRERSRSAVEDIEKQDLLGWTVKAENLIANACGKDSAHLAAFINNKETLMYGTYLNTLGKLTSVLAAAKEDFDGGYIVSIKSLVSAEVLGSELDQAKELYAGKYYTASAVIAGTVLETTLRQICDRIPIPTGKLDKMNADLVKAGVYNTLVQKRITALAGVRNSAAHGKPNEFTADDVADMIEYVERFATDHV